MFILILEHWILVSKRRKIHRNKIIKRRIKETKRKKIKYRIKTLIIRVEVEVKRIIEMKMTKCQVVNKIEY